MKKLHYLFAVLTAALLFLLVFTGCEPDYSAEGTTAGQESAESSVLANRNIDKNGSYTSKEDVMNYLIEYHTLPDNFITKKEARKLGWSGGSLEPYAPGKCIGGDRFGNYEGSLPEKKDIHYYECDIDTLGENSRGAKRIVYSDEGSIYYTEDHYESFTLLYQED